MGKLGAGGIGEGGAAELLASITTSVSPAFPNFPVPTLHTLLTLFAILIDVITSVSTPVFFASPDKPRAILATCTLLAFLSILGDFRASRTSSTSNATIYLPHPPRCTITGFFGRLLATLHTSIPSPMSITFPDKSRATRATCCTILAFLSIFIDLRAPRTSPASRTTIHLPDPSHYTGTGVLSRLLTTLHTRRK